MNFSEIQFELRVKEAKFRTFEYFSYKISSFFEYFDCNVEGSHKQLTLDVLIHVMESCNIWSSVAYH